MSSLAVVNGCGDRTAADLELVAGVRTGDDRAFEELYRRYQPPIAAYVAGMVRDHALVEDVTQEVFLSALRRLRDGSEREIQFRPWIYEIAKNKCIDAYRRRRHTIEVSFDAHEAIGADEHGRLAGPRPTPDDAVDDKLAIDNLCGAFGGLSPVHHEILVLREFEGLSYREIGDRLGLSRAAVESTLFRARKRLSEEYGQLVSGERCQLVRRTVDTVRGIEGGGLRAQRRIARHLAHCQPCRRYARLAGSDLGAAAQIGRARAATARIAALVPLPAFLRRRWDGEEATPPLIGSPAVRPAAQSWAHVAGSIDPALVTGWTKAIATAATVAVAGLGAGSAIGERAGLPPYGSFGSPGVPAVGWGSEPAASSPGASAARQTSGRPGPLSAPGAVPADGPAPAAAGADPAASTGSERSDAERTGAAPTTAPPAATADDTPAGSLEVATRGPSPGVPDTAAAQRAAGPTGSGGGPAPQTPVDPRSEPALGSLIGDGPGGGLGGGSPSRGVSSPASLPSSAPQTPSTGGPSPVPSGTGSVRPPDASGAPTANGDSVSLTVPKAITSPTAALGRGL